MLADLEQFEKEVDSAIDAVEAKSPDEAGEGSPAKEGGVNGDESSDASAGGDSEVDDGEGKEGGVEAPEDNSGDDNGPAEGEGDQEGDGVDGEESKEGEKEVTPAEISEYAIEQAVATGIPFADATAFRSDESLLRVVEARKQSSLATTTNEKYEGDRKEDEANLDDLIAKIPELDPEKFEPETVEMFTALKYVVAQQQEQIRTINEQQGTAEESRAVDSLKEVEGWFDSEIENLGEDFSDVLGRGGYSSLSNGSSQLAKRNEIATQVAVLRSGYEASGMSIPARSEIFKMASRNVLQDEFRSQADKKTAGKLAKRSGQHMQRGSGKKANNQLSPEEEAAQILDQKYPSSR